MKISNILFLLSQTKAISWVGIGNNRDQSETSICESTSLSHIQKRLCARNSKYAPGIQRAATQTISKCKSGMSGEKWGCQGIEKLPKMSKTISSSTAESAYLHSLASGQLIGQLYRLCASGAIGECISNEIEEFTNQFTSVISLVKNIGKKSLVDIELHNNKVGREMAWGARNKICKCHGQSGSCSVKTCYETSPRSEDISKIALEKYEKSVRVELAHENAAVPTQLKNIAKNRLLYIDARDDFCSNESTKGRTCQLDNILESSHCDKLCCGRGGIRSEKMVLENECVFTWPDKIRCTPVAIKKVENICR